VLDYPRATDAFLKDLERRITNAKHAVSEMENNYKHAEDPVARSQILASLVPAKDDLKNLQSNMNWYISKPTESDIANADSELALAQAKFDAAKAVLDSLEIKAPFSGIVFTVEAQIGETYQGETTLFTVGDPKALEVVASVTEEDYPLLSRGQTVELYFDAQPDADVKVDRIIPQQIEGDHPLYNIYITLNTIPNGLADGMTADPAITIAHRDGVLCLPRAVVRASSGDTTTVKVWDGTQELSQQIKTGLRGDTYVELLSGLKEGDQVVTR
jgi:RND family efflux transporter MFP subunit